MSFSPLLTWFHGKRASRGFALVVTLCALVLVTVLILAFFSRSLLNRQVAFSSANLAKTDSLARASIDFVVGELRQEIRDGSTNLDGGSSLYPVVYRPLASSNAVPWKSGIAGADSLGARTLTKVSSTNRFRPNGSTNVVSPVSISAPSLNSRFLSAGRWFGSGGPALGSQSTLPTWVYATRGNGFVVPSVPTAKDRTSNDYVLGRFAFTVYDTSGLLNANVAGYPGVASTNAGGKGTTAYADLSLLDAAFTQAEVDEFVAWRSGSTAVASGTEYANFVRTSGERGFRTIADGGNAFLTRKDLLNAASTGLLTTGVAQNTTHFSRAVNAPSWGPSNIPSATIAYGDNANTAASANRFLSNVRHPANTNVRHYRDNGTSFTYEVLAGDPLMQNRFSLGKLAWIGHQGPAAGGSAAAIRSCFGLQWDSGNQWWSYLETTSSPVAIKTLAQVAQEGREPNFFELLKAGMLSGSLGKSPGERVGGNSTPVPAVGTDVRGPGGAFFEQYSGDLDRQVLQIGANIIDQYDADSYPLAIQFTAFSVSSPYEFYNTLFGIENLPYLHRVALMGYQTSELPVESNAPPATTDSAGNPSYWRFWMVPEVWNPHQPDPRTSLSGRPTSFRVRAYGQARGDFAVTGTHPLRTQQGSIIDYDANPAFRDVYFNDLSAGGSGSSFYRNPAILTRSNADTSATAPINLCPPTLRNVDLGGNNTGSPGFAEVLYAGIYGGSAPYPRNPAVAPWADTPLTVPPTANPGFAPQPRFTPQPQLTLVLEYNDGSRWLPYSTMARIVVPIRNTAGGTTIGLPDGSLQLAGWTWMQTPDPRTNRFSTSVTRTGGGASPASPPETGANSGLRWVPEATAERSSANTRYPAFSTQNNIEDYYPRSAGAGFTYPQYIAGNGSGDAHIGVPMWMINSSTNNQAVGNYDAFYSDPDGIVRFADGFRRNRATGDGCYLYHFTDAGSTASQWRRRPVILNRPFRSVGELGYAYRDLPGKNVDFWSPTSADAGLLDLFAISDSFQATGSKTLTADGVSVNAATAKSLSAMFSGAIESDTAASAMFSLSRADADQIAQALVTRLSAASPPIVGSRADLAVALGADLNTALAASSAAAHGVAANKALAETPVRALADSLNTRTWNLLVDVVAQSGRISERAATLADFTVEGERRYWMHVAIDRMTGKIVGQQLEPVYE